MKTFFTILSSSFLLFSCQTNVLDIEKEAAQSKMEQHLQAVANRDIDHLKSTLSETGEMKLILPDQEIIKSTEGFLDFHRGWFEDTSWTFDYEIKEIKVGSYYGFAIVEVMYKEPSRNGKPYFNKMTVSYVLEKQKGQWVIILDHASSIEKG